MATKRKVPAAFKARAAAAKAMTPAQRKAWAEKMRRAKAAKAGKRTKKSGHKPKSRKRAAATPEHNPVVSATAKKRGKGKMATRRNRKGQFVKGHGGGHKRKTKRRASKRRTASVVVVRNNPAPAVVSETLEAGGAAIIGGLVAIGGVGLVNRLITNPGVRTAASVIVPVLVGAAATQFGSHNVHGPGAAGAFGVAGAMVGLAGSQLFARANPPGTWVWDNPPRVGHQGFTPGALPSAWKSPLRAVS